ncbi:MAG: septation protein IspZ [Pseudomonadota bacterium]
MSDTTVKSAVDYGPLAVFLAVFFWQGLMAATVALMVATGIALAVSYLHFRKLPLMPMVTAAVVMVFGGLTIWLNDDTFIKMKPTIIYALFALAIAVGLALRKTVLKALLGSALSLTDAGWRGLSLRFIGFFLVMAAANEIIRRVAPDHVWVLWKVPGSIIVTVAFMIAQAPFVKRHEPTEQAAGE